MFTKAKAKEMQEYLNRKKREKPAKAYKAAEEMGRGYEAIELKRGKKK